MQVDLTYLASPSLAGRVAGTPGNDSAAEYIAKRYWSLGLHGAFSGVSCGLDEPCKASFFQLFQYRNAYPGTIDGTSQNVAAIVPGTDSTLSGEYVVVGGHYDHLGLSNDRGVDPLWQFPTMHLGADDNGSGTVAVLELARRFAVHPARRPVMFANFSAEELGLIGSTAFIKNSPVPRDAIVTMVNLDMIGRLRDKHLIVYGSGDNDKVDRLVDSVKRLPPALDLEIDRQSFPSSRSDQGPFARVGIPVIGFFTGFHADYHRSGDVVARINFPGMESIVELAERVIRTIADGNNRPRRN